LVRFPQKWFNQIVEEIGEQWVYLPWYDSVNGVDYIVEGTFFVEEHALTPRVSEVFEFDSVHVSYTVQLKDIQALKAIEARKTAPVEHRLGKGKLVTIASRSSIYNGMKAVVCCVFPDETALCKAGTRSYTSFDVVPCNLLIEEE
jgi:hypothetical protein